MTPLPFALAQVFPQLALAGSLVGVLAFGAWPKRAPVAELRALAVAALAAAAFLVPQMTAGGELVGWDGWARSWQLLFFAGALPLVLLLPAADEVPVALVLGSVLGMSLLAVARNFLVLFVGLELMSLPAYVLVFSLRRSRVSLEAALKYFFAGGAAGALFLLGMAAAYAASGSLALAPLSGPSAGLALALMGAAALFKIGVFPLHFWLPDVYEASVPELTGFLSTSMKAAGFLLLMRLLSLGGFMLEDRASLIAVLPAAAAMTMTLGNLLALRQTSLQRLLAYSSVAHAGYLLMGVSAWSQLGARPEAASSVYFYLAAYLAMNTGAFAVLKLSGLRTVAELRGFARREPVLAAFLALMLVSLGGLPPTAGFLAKLFVFWDAVKAGEIGLVLVAGVNSLIGLAYYFRLIRAAYLEDPWEEGAPPVHLPLPEQDAPDLGEDAALPSIPGRAVLWACGAATLLLGVCPWAAAWAAELLR